MIKYTIEDKLEKLVSYFFIYSFLAWIYEQIFFILMYNSYEYRGFLYLPILPIYGFGAVLISLIYPDNDYNILSIFVVGGILCTFIEFSTSLILEKILFISLWDYSDMKYHIDGRISLFGITAISFACVLLIKVLNPLLDNILKKIQKSKIYTYVLCLLIILVFLDFIVSFYKF